MKKIFTMMAAALMAVSAQAQTWNFAGAVSETDDVYAQDATNWTWVDSRWNYQPATDNAPLMVGEAEAEATKGLKFTAGAANSTSKSGKIRIAKDQLQLNGKSIVVTLPALKQGYTVEVVWKTGSSSGYNRYLEPTNLSNTSKFEAVANNDGAATEETDKGNQNGVGTVTEDGVVTLTTMLGGINVYSITVKDTQGNVLTKEQVLALSEGGEQGGEQGGETTTATVWTANDLTTGTAYSEMTTIEGVVLNPKSGHTITVEDAPNSKPYTGTFTNSAATAYSATKQLNVQNVNTDLSTDPIANAMTKRRTAEAGMSMDYIAFDVTEAGTAYVITRTKDDSAGRAIRLGFQLDSDKSYTTADDLAATKTATEMKLACDGAGTYFLYASAAFKVVAIYFEPKSATSAIETVKTRTATDGMMYNLAGQKVGKDYKGIAIMNGRKVVVK